MPSYGRLSANDPRAALMRRLQAAWNRGDLDAMMGGHRADAVYVMVGGIEPLASFGELHIEVEQAIAAGERVLLILNQHNRGEAGGADTFNCWGQLLSFREGLIARAENYYDVDEALKAIGEG